MKYIYKYLIIFTSTLLHSPKVSWSQQNDSIVPQMSLAALHQDWDIMVEQVIEIHPAAFRYTDSAQLLQLSQVFKSKLKEGDTPMVLHSYIRQWITYMGCGHTVARPSDLWYKYQKDNPVIIPMEVFIVGNTLRIRGAAGSDSAHMAQSTLISINGIAADTILMRLRNIQQRDGYHQSFVDNEVSRLFRTYFLFEFGPAESYIVTYQTPTHEIRQSTLEAGYSWKHSISAPKLTDTLFQHHDVAFFAAYEVDRFFQNQGYEPTSTLNTAWLDFDAFTGDGHKKFYKEVFEYMDTAQIKNLVIDVRQNGGGYFPAGNELLRYLLQHDFYFYFSRPHRKKPSSEYISMPISAALTRSMFSIIPDDDKSDPDRNYRLHYNNRKKRAFKGNIYLLTDGGSFSLSSYIAAQLQHQTEAVLMGEETGGAELGSNAVISYTVTLPNSGIKVIVPYYFLNHKIEKASFGHGVKPDVEIEDPFFINHDQLIHRLFDYINGQLKP